MAIRINTFIDEMLDDVVRQWMRERDFEPAYWRNECQPQSLVRLNACRVFADAQRRRLPIAPVRLNNLRGRCAEERLIRRLCGRSFDVRNQVRVGPRRGGSVLDVSPFPGARRQLPTGLESKYVYVPDYRDAAGRIQVGAILARVPGDVAQVRRHMAQSVPPPRPGVPHRVRLMYQLGGAMSEVEFRQLGRALYAAVAQASGRTPGPPVAATVVRALG